MWKKNMEGKGENRVVQDAFSQMQEGETELEMRALKQDR